MYVDYRTICTLKGVRVLIHLPTAAGLLRV
jgi:hypothetical protein